MPLDQVFVVQKERKIETHSLNGKLIDKFQGAHTSEVRGLEHNMTPMCATLVTVSSDACALWSATQGNSVTKQKSLFAKDGNHFV